jgi:hypothetical protein
MPYFCSEVLLDNEQHDGEAENKRLHLLTALTFGSMQPSDGIPGAISPCSGNMPNQNKRYLSYLPNSRILKISSF